ncbi:MAG: 5-methyltetrahydropteroyltriglutamate--homocysteine S-methyltransferase [Desulfovibrio sp.]|jgi:5-methyltetrahydropteroyltriglutamate--homocysteine methyltransferase|nr:5-methyltetrahydropteroyltriglutamate--homocysteine S-methyltransferase [Desulfovibrio sp.]
MQTHILGFPRIGKKRELKQALESFWKGTLSTQAFIATSMELKKRHWEIQESAGLDYVTTGDFSLYDQMLDTTLMLGAVPPRFSKYSGDSPLDLYFNMARGDAKHNIPALEMTKWFDTNYHYLVPEIDANGPWVAGIHPVVADTRLARKLGYSPKPVLIGPFTWLALAKAQGSSLKWSRLDAIVSAYASLLGTLSAHCDYIQIDEPVLCTDLLPEEARKHFHSAYAALNADYGKSRLLLATYFGPLGRNLELAVNSGCAALHVDLVRGKRQLEAILPLLPAETALSLGVVDGRNIWKTDFSKIVPGINQAVAALGSERVLLASSCSLLHCPVDTAEESALPDHIKKRMAFAVQKCFELTSLRKIVEQNDPSVLAENVAVLRNSVAHPHTSIAAVRERSSSVTPAMFTRLSPYPQRREKQHWLNLPELPTTTIGSFPQTASIRKTRLDYKQGDMSEANYIAAIRHEIRDCIEKQEALGLDVFVHGEAERNDMVEYFGQQLGGFCFTQNGWVQSYGSRCVKPPVIYGDVYRKAPMTVDWILYAQSLTVKPVKGMLTGPVTILCWSFVRDDMARSEVCKQIALAIRDEVQDLEKAGVRIIQIDEAALREGMPLTAQEAEIYLKWAVDAFRLSSSGVKDSTQIHTHMCYSEFNAILPWIARMDADVISIESSRSGMELLDAFTDFRYQGAVGPGVYDIHSPRISSVEEMTELLRRALRHIPKEQLWVNPDCGLKTRQWEEAYPTLENMVSAAKRLRGE